MVGKYSVYMNGIELQAMDDAIILTDIVENEPQVNNVTISKADGGTILLRSQRQNISVNVSFALKEYDAERRKDICRLVYAWARDGYLEVSDRPDQRLKVSCVAPPVLRSSSGGTDNYTFTLTAFERPYWESNYESKGFSNISKTATATIAILGERDALLSCDVLIKSGTMNRLTIRTGISKIVLEGLSIASGNSVQVAYTKEGYMTIKQGANSLYSALTPTSDDVLKIPAGTSEVTLESNTTITATLTARGVFE